MYNQNFYYKDASMLGIIAPRGVGKTLLLTCLAYEELRAASTEKYQDFKIFHNGFLNHKWKGWRIPGDKKVRLQRFGIEDIIQTVESGVAPFENGLVVIDEVASIQDNRYGAMGLGTVLFSHFIVMIRKVGLTILWAGQNEELDRRIKMQTDIVLYPVVARHKKGREIGFTAVYQNGTYAHEGKKRKFMIYDLNKFWKAYDTNYIIKSEQVYKSDLAAMRHEIKEDQVFEMIVNKVRKSGDPVLSIMEIKQLMVKELKANWETKELNKFLKMVGNPVKGSKSQYDFSMLT
tara:strand:+ start:2477 stop:3346 length:870 start_codon:yes stop_codon:yes gene_type:complete